MAHWPSLHIELFVYLEHIFIWIYYLHNKLPFYIFSLKFVLLLFKTIFGQFRLPLIQLTIRGNSFDSILYVPNQFKIIRCRNQEVKLIGTSPRLQSFSNRQVKPHCILVEHKIRTLFNYHCTCFSIEISESVRLFKQKNR